MWPEVMDVIIANSVWSRVIKAQPANTNYPICHLYYIYLSFAKTQCCKCSDSVTILSLPYIYLTMNAAGKKTLNVNFNSFFLYLFGFLRPEVISYC